MWRVVLVLATALVLAAFYSREGLCSLAEFEEANIKGQMPKPICANGFVLEPSTICAPYDMGCAPGFHVVCPGVTVNQNGSCV